MNQEQIQRHRAMVQEWIELGHPKAPCTGHGYPGLGCPAPAVHAQVFPPEQALTFDKVMDALKAVFEDLDSTGRAGDEWAYEWVHEVWPRLVPLVVRKAVGEEDAAENPAVTPCRNCPHPLPLHDTEGCTVTIPQTEDPDFGPTQTCPCCVKGTP